jgi:hypothetical protein
MTRAQSIRLKMLEMLSRPKPRQFIVATDDAEADQIIASRMAGVPNPAEYEWITIITGVPRPFRQIP